MFQNSVVRSYCLFRHHFCLVLYNYGNILETPSVFIWMWKQGLHSQSIPLNTKIIYIREIFLRMRKQGLHSRSIHNDNEGNIKNTIKYNIVRNLDMGEEEVRTQGLHRRCLVRHIMVKILFLVFNVKFSQIRKDITPKHYYTSAYKNCGTISVAHNQILRYFSNSRSRNYG